MNADAQPLYTHPTVPITHYTAPTDFQYLMDADLSSASKCLSFILHLISTTPANAGTKRCCGDRWVIDPTPRSYRLDITWGFVDVMLYTRDYEVILMLRERLWNDGSPYWCVEYVRIRRLNYRKLKVGDRHMMTYHYQHGNHQNDTEQYNEMISHEKYNIAVMRRVNNHFHILGNWW